MIVPPLCRLPLVTKSAARDNADLGDPQERAQLAAEIVYGLYGDDALEMLAAGQDEETEDDGEKSLAHWRKGLQLVRGWWRKAWDAARHPRNERGQFIKIGSGEAHAAAREAVGRVLRGDMSAASAESLAGHLSLLTVKQLRELHRDHGKPIPGRLRAQLVEAVIGRLGIKGAEGGEATAASTLAPHAAAADALLKSPSADTLAAAAKEHAAAGRPPEEFYAAVQQAYQRDLPGLKRDLAALGAESPGALLEKGPQKEAEPAGPAKGKAPHEMTRRQYVGSGEGKLTRGIEHGEAVKQAILAGQDVSAKVLRDYPGMAREVEIARQEKQRQQDAADSLARQKESAQNPEKVTAAEYLKNPEVAADLHREWNRRAHSFGRYVPFAEYVGTEGKNRHKAAVAAALAAGKPVPPEVLADYPDLAPQSTAAVPPPVSKLPSVTHPSDAAGAIDALTANYGQFRNSQGGRALGIPVVEIARRTGLQGEELRVALNDLRKQGKIRMVEHGDNSTLSDEERRVLPRVDGAFVSAIELPQQPATAATLPPVVPPPVSKLPSPEKTTNPLDNPSPAGDNTSVGTQGAAPTKSEDSEMTQQTRPTRPTATIRVQHARGYERGGGKLSRRSYVAKINGASARYGLNREFLEPDDHDWGDSEYRKPKGVYHALHTVDEPGIYEVNEHGDPEFRVYYQAPDGTLQHHAVSRAETIQSAIRNLEAAGMTVDDLPAAAAAAHGREASLLEKVDQHIAAQRGEVVPPSGEQPRTTPTPASAPADPEEPLKRRAINPAALRAAVEKVKARIAAGESPAKVVRDEWLPLHDSADREAAVEYLGGTVNPGENPLDALARHLGGPS